MPKRIDTNQNEIVKTLRAVGAFVQSLASVGRGTPDLLVAFRGDWHVMEVKTGTLAPSKRRLTADEAVWWEQAERIGQVDRVIVESPEDALRVIGAV